MTDDELKALVAENSLAIREMREEGRASRQQWEQSRQQWEQSRQQSERRWKQYLQESEQSRQESERRWEQHLQESEQSRQESERRWEQYLQESEQSRQESERLWQEILVSRQETDRLITNLNRDFGRLGNKLGGYSESLIRPSLKRALREQFGMTSIASPLSIEKKGESLEIDMVGHAENERQEVYVVEIKSQLRKEAIDQLDEHMRRLPRFFPEHRGKKLFGILAALDIPRDLKTQVLKRGIYLATIKDDVFEIVPPDDFVPRAYGLREA